MTASPVAEGTTVAQKYRVDSVIGEGGMGVVVQAWHLELEQRVAIKFLWEEIAQHAGSSERFRREARAAAKIKSEHVGRVLDVGTLDSGVPFIVMEYLEGRDLNQELGVRLKIPIAEAVDYVLQACEALAEAHVNGIVHRDLKPENLFLANQPDGTRTVKVLDFGVSKSLYESQSGRQRALTKTSTLVGSPLYMSPEQLDAAKDLDQRADVWAIGVILYELISGTTPFAGTTIPQVCNAVMHQPPRSFAEVNAAVPEELEKVVRRALEKDRNKRWSTVADFASALRPFAPPESVASIARISRVLGVSIVEAPIAGDSSTDRAATSVTMPGAGEEPLPREGTVDSWGGTHGGASSTRRYWWLAALALPVFIGVAYVTTQPESGATTLPLTPESAGPDDSERLGAQAPETPIVAEPEPVQAERAGELESPPPTDAPSASASKPTAPAVKVRPSIVETARAAPKPRPTPRRKPKASVPATEEPRKAAAEAKPTATSAISDFGGRR